MSDRTLKIGNYTLKDIHQIIHIYGEKGIEIDATDVIETLAKFDDELDIFIHYFSAEQIDDIIKWYFAIDTDDDNTFFQEEKYYRNKLKVIKYLKSRELEKYLQKTRFLVNLEVFSDDSCRIISRDGFLPCYVLQNVESITNFTLISIKKEELGIVYLFERGDVL